jgi:xanthine dehydrogenase iron-sulfur cluster and FAD-binding subunit A
LIGGLSGIREVRLADFFTGYRQTAVGVDELLVALRIDDRVPPPRGRRVAWVRKVARRDRVDISTVAGAFLVVLDDRGTVVSARLAYGGVAATPVRALGAEDALIGAVWRDGDGGVKDARALLGSAFAPLSDHRGSASYRQRLITGLFDACLSETGIGSDR